MTVPFWEFRTDREGSFVNDPYNAAANFIKIPQRTVEVADFAKTPKNKTERIIALCFYNM